MRDDIRDRLQHSLRPEIFERTLRWAESPNHHVVALGDANYPPWLHEIADAPPILYVIGRVDLLSAPSLGVVGSRNATERGMRDAREMSRTLSDAGLAIVSGLALGIDAAAHEGGLAGASSSIAVMATGADKIYPKRNAALAQRLAEQGALVTEFPLGTPPLPHNFPERNRIISGLARGVLVVEAALESGSLITARRALGQNREVFAIPGSVHAPLSRGCNHLIANCGALLVQSAADILAELNMPCPAPNEGEAARLAPAQAALLDAMGFAPVTVDQVASSLRRSVAEVAASLCELEIAGAIASAAGGRFQRLA